jgi:hypothetical protein
MTQSFFRFNLAAMFGVAACVAIAPIADASTGGPSLERGRAFDAQYVLETDPLRSLADEASARAMAVADFDEDGVADLVISGLTPAGGILVLYRGNIDAIHPNTIEAKARRRLGKATQAAFLSPARVTSTPEVADFLAAGDFDADGHIDLVVASTGGDALLLLQGDGQGEFAPARLLDLPGQLTAMVSGEINRRDGLADLVVAVRTNKGPRVLVFEGPAGAFAADPKAVEIEAEATGLALGELDDMFGIDLVIAADTGLSILRGRDRRRSNAAESRSSMSRFLLGFSIAAIGIGDFVDDSEGRSELAVLSKNGSVYLVAYRGPETADTKLRTKEMQADGWSFLDEGNWLISPEDGRLDVASEVHGRAVLSTVRRGGNGIDDLVVTGWGGDRVHLVSAVTEGKAHSLLCPAAPEALPEVAGNPGRMPEPGAEEHISPWTPDAVPLRSAAAIPIEWEPLDALPMRLNSDAVSDLVVLVEGRLEPVILNSKAGEIVVVNSTTDVEDGATTSITDLNTSPGDDGVISLREAISAANNTTGADTIHFNIPTESDTGCDAQSGVCTIQPLASGLPTITQPVTIDGTSQPTFQTTPVIQIDGSLTDANATGLAVNSGSSTIRGLVINRFATNSDIVMWGSGNNVIEGNFLGVDPSGTANLGSTNSVHVYAISNNLIGGTTAASRNVVSGNTNPAIALNEGAANNLVQGNFLGTDLTGTIGLGNSGNDIVALASPDNTIGGTTVGAGNLIAANLDPDFASVGLGFAESTGNLVQGNLVGTDITGTSDLGGASIGVYINEGSNNTIGGTSPSAPNLISGGGASGVGIAAANGNFVEGNFIGTQIDGVNPLANASHGVLLYAGAAGNIVGGREAGAGNTIANNGASGVELRGDAGVGNTIAGNVIADNEGLGINTCADFDTENLVCNDPVAVTPNDPDDPDTGPNNLQNFPVLTSVVADTVGGSLDSTPGSDFTIDIYANPECDPDGFGEGESFVGSGPASTDLGGDAAFTIALTESVPSGWYLTATATGDDGSTSEFSQCFEVPSDTIFSDGFESGSTSEWSNTQP